MTLPDTLEKRPMGRGPFRESPPENERLDGQPNDRQIAMMLWIWLHGPVSTYHLYAKFNDISYDGFKDSIKKLWRKGYVHRPYWQNVGNVDYHAHIYDLTPKGIKFLKDNGLWFDAIRADGPGEHQFENATITATADIWCDRNGFEYIPPHIYLANAKHRKTIPDVPFRWHDGEVYECDLKSDSVFGITQDGETRGYFLEGDRDTEAIKATRPDEKSFLRSGLQYHYIIGHKKYKEIYRVDHPMKALFVTTSESHMQNAMSKIEAQLDASYSLLFTHDERFHKRTFKPPYVDVRGTDEKGCEEYVMRHGKSIMHLMEEPWSRIGRDPFTLRNKKTT